MLFRSIKEVKRGRIKEYADRVEGATYTVFEGKAMETANKRISKTYNIPKNARLDSSIPGRQSGRNTTPAR